MSIKSLSDKIVEFTKKYTFTIENANQTYNDVTYFPVNYGFRFYDDQLKLLGTDNTSLITTLTRQVNKQTGKRTLASSP
ncbi:MAG: hypothetical protein ACFFC6_00625 [Promethearchaeota archaeon]